MLPFFLRSRHADFEPLLSYQNSPSIRMFRIVTKQKNSQLTGNLPDGLA